jgi:AcrR family transcriptional regulator
MTRHSAVPERIIHSAVVLFSRQGYHGTSAREIARLAQVSEVTVYRYFEHKEDIFRSALDLSFSDVKPRLKVLAPASRCEPPEVMLPRIVSLLQNIVSFSPELLRLIAIAFLEVHGKAEDTCREHLALLFTAIDDYLKVNIQTGKIRNLDAAIATAAIALTTLAQPELSKLTGLVKLTPLDNHQAIDEYASFWVNALVPSSQERLQDNVAVKA